MLVNNWTVLDIAIGGERLNLSAPGTLLSFIIIASENNKIPSLEFSFLSNSEYVKTLEDLSCADDYSLIQVTVGPNTNNLISIPFRLLSWKKKSTDNGLVVKVIGIYDKLAFIANTAPIITQYGSSSSFVKLLAERYLNGTKLFTNITLDNMLRGTFGYTPSDAIDYYTKSAWLDNNSLFKTAVDLDGKLVFTNVLNSMNSTNKNIKFRAIGDNDIYLDYITKNTQTDTTIKKAYSSVISVSNIIRTETQSNIEDTELTKINLKVPTSYSININKNAKNELNVTEYKSLIDIGNVHTNFYQAVYNNERYSAMLNNEYMGIVSGILTNLDILSTYNMFSEDNSFSIPVYVSKKIITLVDDRYEEDYILKTLYTPKTSKNIDVLY